MKKLTLGILAHVDAGKTTLTESLLLSSGVINKAGRVDHGDAFLDTESLEKQRGVTIISKQAVISLDKDNRFNSSGDDLEITIIDTPGHTDFVGETERALAIMDMAILVVSASDGVTGSTKKLARMLKHYKLPYIIFVNKMDLFHGERDDLISEIRAELDVSADVLPFDMEYVAGISEKLIEKYFETGEVEDSEIRKLIIKSQLHPVVFGTALKNEGSDELLSLVSGYMPEVSYREEFGARIFKITYENSRKLSFAKITGGKVNVRDVIEDEKITEIRRYNGGRFESLTTAEAGDIVTFLGMDSSYIGKGLGFEMDFGVTMTRPLLRYLMVLPFGITVREFLPKMRELSAEDPLIGNLETEGEDKIYISVMGDFQLEILAAKIKERYDVSVSFTEGRVIYKETIAAPVIGYGHFEPLRHYSEVHILIEPLPQGSGVQIGTDLSVNELSIQFQKTVLDTMSRELPRGVLTGAELTDVKLTLIAGKSHTKHSNSEDFREAAKRAIRQGLMQAENVLLEPYMMARITLPSELVGRIYTDIEQMNGKCEIEEDASGSNNRLEKAGKTSLRVSAPAREIGNYQAELAKFAADEATMEFLEVEYQPCRNPEEIIEDIHYDPERDVNAPSHSVFCSHGAGEIVPWDECQERMHVEDKEAFYLRGEESSLEDDLKRQAALLRKKYERENEKAKKQEDKIYSIGTEEVDRILREASHSNEVEGKRTKRVYFERNASVRSSVKKKKEAKPPFLIVDGYNMIYSWKDLKGLTKSSEDMEGARWKLIEILSEYAVLKETEIMVVFDAYKVKGHYTTYMKCMGVHVVYTKEAETADQYIARYTKMNAKDFDITVATSDRMIQIFVLGEDSKVISAGVLENDVASARKSAMELV
ncbi:MAG: TetM/TetW/TetO/TetS family tetracycline resistance ribosomal protection protein [Eubacterium sp.]|nr:TetM/TetW/TetO/TetS family tetracycline resistance ribosomal protection protein [Eubacterium sp.]